jgi:UDP-GlcNAc3NAcA epimerase
VRAATIVGARPQFIKAAMLSRALRSLGIEEVLIHTGQHYDDNMSNVFFDELEIPAPSFNLAVGSGPHGAQTGRMLEAIEAALLAARPDMAVVYGDTNTTLAGALAAAKLHVPLAHVEAGLRSFDRRMPEEVNRVLTDHASDLLFAPTKTAVDNLLREGIADAKIRVSGDVMYDAALHYGAKAERQSLALEKLGLKRGSFVLVTVHRAENTDEAERMETLCSALTQIARAIPIVMPIHPRTQMALSTKGILDSLAGAVRLIDPAGYLDMMMLEKNARLIVTDSGGVQKEAFFYRVPCVTLRDRTEWVELVELGWNRLVPLTSPEGVVAAVRDALEWRPRACQNPFGNGRAAESIALALQQAGAIAEPSALASVAH